MRPKRKTRAVDWSKIRDPSNQQALCEALQSIPIASWEMHPTDQVHVLTKSIHEVLRKTFPLQGARFRKPYITEAIWGLRSRRCNLRALLRSMHRHFGNEQFDLWFGFRRLKNARCNCTVSRIIVPNLVTELCIPLLRETAKHLKATIKKERAAFVERVSTKANSSNTAQVFAELGKLGVNGKLRKRGTPPLPLWRDAHGRVAEDPAERANLWRERCGSLEAGTSTTAQQLIQRAEARRTSRKQMSALPSFDELPSLSQIEAKLRAVRKNKAPGNDLLRSELCSMAAAPLAKHIHALTTKFVTFLDEPIQWKGGTLIAAYKHSGRMNDLRNYRSLLLSDHLGKSMRSWLRERFRGIYTEISSPTHFAGKMGGNPSRASSLARAFLEGMGRRGYSCSAYFVDVSSAYYRVVRELLVGMQTTDQEIIAILERFGLGPNEFRALQEHLHTAPVLQQHGVTDRDATIMESLLECTWFTVEGPQEVTRTRAGSRPGDTFADLVFAFVYSQMLQVLRDALADNGFVTPDDLAYGDEWKSIEVQGVEMKHAPALIDVTWADDLVLLQAHEDGRELIRRTTLAGGLLGDLCSRRGLQLNYKAGKTECLLRLKGKGTKALRLELFDCESPCLRLPSTLQEDLHVRIVAQYKHLGTQITMASSQMHEIRVRTGQARAVYNKHRKTVFQNPLIAVPVRVKLLNSLVLSILNYNQGTWRPLKAREWNYYQAVVMNLYRGLVRATVPYDELQEWSHERVLAFLEVASPQSLLHASRLRYLGALWRGAPNIVWWMHHMEKSWFEALSNAMDWLNLHTAGLKDRAAAQQRAVTWHQVVPHAQAWKSFIRKATRHDIATSKAEELKHRWHFDFVERLIEKGLEVEHSELLVTGIYADGLPHRHSFGCLFCGMTFATKSGWSVHAFRKHGRVAPERHAIHDTVCAPCNKQYHTTQRLLRHLRHSESCAAVMLAMEETPREIMPGRGSSNLDQDRTFPLPVIQLAGPHRPLPVEGRVCRPTFSEPLLRELIGCVIESDELEVEDCVVSCWERLKSSTECSDVILRTLDAFVEHFHHSELITLQELRKANHGKKVSLALKDDATFERMFPEQRHEATPSALRGATYRAVQMQQDRAHSWQPVTTVLRCRSRTLIIAHLFSGHRRKGDLTGFLENLPTPAGAVIVVIPIDIIYDSIRCDLARRETQIRWRAIARLGSLLGFVAGPPCETFSVARAKGGRAGETSGDGGPRQLRSNTYPYGLPSMTEDERRHTHTHTWVTVCCGSPMIFVLNFCPTMKLSSSWSIQVRPQRR